MRGKIEVYKNYGSQEQELVMEGANTIVDGAGALLADIMMAPAALSSITDLSSILDTSNYTIQAISFGKDVSAYQRNAHACVQGTNKANAGYTGGIQSLLISPQDLTLSSYDPSFAGNILPSFVSPRQTQLELSALTSGIVSVGATLLDLQTSSPGITNVGHNLNVLAHANQLSETNEGANPEANMFRKGFGSFFGCYPAASGEGGTNFYVVSADSQITTGSQAHGHPLRPITSGTYNSLFNQVSSMDLSGFVDFAGSSYTSGTSTFQSSGASGLVVSADVVDGNFSSTGEIVYRVMIGSGDLGTANLYGGIYNLGLWSMDLCEALKNNNPPFSFDVFHNKKRYKLFSKKSLLDNLAKTSDGVNNAATNYPGVFNYEDLTLIWRLFFL